MQLSNQETDPSNTFVENERQKYEKQGAIGNVEHVSKKFSFF